VVLLPSQKRPVRILTDHDALIKHGDGVHVPNAPDTCADLHGLERRVFLLHDVYICGGLKLDVEKTIQHV